MAQNPMDPFNSDMNDIFNQLMGGVNGYNSENRRYMINGREVTPEVLLNTGRQVNYLVVQHHKLASQVNSQTKVRRVLSINSAGT